MSQHLLGAPAWHVYWLRHPVGSALPQVLLTSHACTHGGHLRGTASNAQPAQLLNICPEAELPDGRSQQHTSQRLCTLSCAPALCMVSLNAGTQQVGMLGNTAAQHTNYLVLLTTCKTTTNSSAGFTSLCMHGAKGPLHMTPRWAVAAHGLSPRVHSIRQPSVEHHHLEPQSCIRRERGGAGHATGGDECCCHVRTLVLWRVHAACRTGHGWLHTCMLHTWLGNVYRGR